MAFSEQYQNELDFLNKQNYGKKIIDKDILAQYGLQEYKAPTKMDSFIALVTPLNGGTSLGRRLFIHYGVGPKSNQVLCPQQMANQRCPICEAREAAKANDDVVSMKALNWTLRYALYVVDMTNEATVAEGVKLYLAPKTIVTNLITLAKNKRTGEFTNLADLSTGKTLIFTRIGTTQNQTEYRGFQLEDRQPFTEDMVAHLPPYEDLFTIYSYEELKEMMGEVEYYAQQPAQAPAPKAPARQAPTQQVSEYFPGVKTPQQMQAEVQAAPIPQAAQVNRPVTTGRQMPQRVMKADPAVPPFNVQQRPARARQEEFEQATEETCGAEDLEQRLRRKLSNG